MISKQLNDLWQWSDLTEREIEVITTGLEVYLNQMSGFMLHYEGSTAKELIKEVEKAIQEHDLDVERI